MFDRVKFCFGPARNRRDLQQILMFKQVKTRAAVLIRIGKAS